MPFARRLRITVFAYVGLVVAAAGCARGFEVRRYAGNNERLYQVSSEQFRKKKWENAIAGFEKLTTDLPARDTLLPRSHYYLGVAHERRGEHLLAAQSFDRLAETFPDDSLADDALFQAGQAYQKMWRKPQLDPQYGQQAIATYRSLLSAYPDSPLAARSTKRIGDLEQWLATKDYDSGMHYYRRKAFDSAIIYFKDVVATYPTTPKAKEAYLKLHQAYRRIRYAEDAREVCDTLRQRYPADQEVRRECGGAPASAAAQTPPTP
jgi:outer membrane protein assembly factor BamD